MIGFHPQQFYAKRPISPYKLQIGWSGTRHSDTTDSLTPTLIYLLAHSHMTQCNPINWKTVLYVINVPKIDSSREE